MRGVDDASLPLFHVIATLRISPDDDDDDDNDDGVFTSTTLGCAGSKYPTKFIASLLAKTSARL